MQVTRLIILSAACAGLMLSTTTATAQTKGTYLSNSDRMKLARYAARNNQSVSLEDYIDLDDARDDAFRENVNECGNVEIGNVQGGQIGAPRPDIDIIIAGDLIVAPGADC